ncbi:2-oxo-hepta-3-ene-1,7-dioic acid hydratase [soil metagenome]
MRLEEAYQQQLHHWRATLDSGAMRVGWKIGLNVPAVQEKLGLERSAVGHLTTATLVGADGSHSLAGAERPKVEPEIAIVMGPDRQIAELAPALEVVDIDPESDDAGEIVAHNIFHRAVAIGSSGDATSAEGVQATLTVNGEAVQTADAGAFDLPGVVALVDETLRAAGESLDAGDRIIAGSLTTPAEVSPGDRVAVDLGPLGRLEVAFT